MALKATYSASASSILCICKLFQPKPVGVEKHVCHRGDKISKQTGKKKKEQFSDLCKIATGHGPISLDQPSIPLPGHLTYPYSFTDAQREGKSRAMTAVEHCGNDGSPPSLGPPRRDERCHSLFPAARGCPQQGGRSRPSHVTGLSGAPAGWPGDGQRRKAPLGTRHVLLRSDFLRLPSRLSFPS